MTQLVFQSLLMNQIWMLLLLQRVFSEVPVLILLYLILDHLYGSFSCFRRLFVWVQDSADNLRFKLSFFGGFFFYLGFLSQPLTNHKTAGEGGGHFLNSSLPLPPISQTLRLSFFVVFFWMVHKKKLFRRSSVKYRTFSEGPT